jgi:hypothetical protein
MCFLQVDLKISRERFIQVLSNMLVTERSLLVILFKPAQDLLTLTKVWFGELIATVIKQQVLNDQDQDITWSCPSCHAKHK